VIISTSKDRRLKLTITTDVNFPLNFVRSWAEKRRPYIVFLAILALALTLVLTLTLALTLVLTLSLALALSSRTHSGI